MPTLFADFWDVEIMSVTEKRVHGIESQLGQIAQRIANLEGHREASSKPNRSTHPLLIALFTVMTTGVLWYVAWIGLQVVKQGNQISQILIILTPQVVKQASLQPDNPKSAEQIQRVVKKAMTEGERIDPHIVSEAGTKFADASRQEPSAWQATTALLNYASFLNVDLPSKDPIQPFDKRRVSLQFNFTRIDGAPRRGEGFVMGATHSPNIPEAHRIGEPDQNSHLDIGPEFFIVKNDDIVLDDMFLKNVVIQDSRIVYNGSPLILQNVYFINCTFEIRREQRAVEFAKAIFTANRAVNLSGA